jgi:hypothetical protein
MRVCGHCGTENADGSTRCTECEWPLPKVHVLAKIGYVLKLTAASAALLIIVAHAVGFFLPGVGEGERHENHLLYSWLFFLCGIGIAAAVYWIGDFLKRSY